MLSSSGFVLQPAYEWMVQMLVVLAGE